jgi:teichoic acid glycerol-phosphate primase
MTQNNPKIAAINFTIDHKVLDHIIPLCHIMDMTLIVVEKSNYDIVRKHYPTANVIYYSYDDISYEDIVRNYDLIFQASAAECDILKYFAGIMKKKVCFALCPHGNSDKGHIKPLLATAVMNDMLLFNGPHMEERLRQQNLLHSVKTSVEIGNYRYRYYLDNKSFYDGIFTKEIKPYLDSRKKTILYAPTWDDGESASSFFKIAPLLAEQLPDDYNLIVKPHPMLEEHHPAQYYITSSLFDKKSNAIVMNDHFPIFPLLENVDIYLGDFSSIGYDFLTFNRPLFFFNQKNIEKGSPSLYLHKCGVTIPTTSYTNIFSFIAKHTDPWPNNLLNNQKETYKFTFGDDPNFLQIKTNILSAYNTWLTNKN